MRFTSLLRPSLLSEKSRILQAPATPKIDHILLEVSNLTASIAFYRDFVGLHLKSQSDWFVMLESNNVGVFLRNSRWDWEKPHSKRGTPGAWHVSPLRG